MAKALDYILRLLNRRSYFEGEIVEKLKRKKFDQEEIDSTLTKLKNAELINDERLLKYIIENRLKYSGRGPNYIYAELLKRKAPKELIKENVTAISKDDELESAKEFAIKKTAKFKDLPKYEYKQKIMALLARRGYKMNVAITIANELIDL